MTFSTAGERAGLVLKIVLIVVAYLVSSAAVLWVFALFFNGLDRLVNKLEPYRWWVALFEVVLLAAGYIAWSLTIMVLASVLLALTLVYNSLKAIYEEHSD
jgi:hypothetical protein